MNDRIVKAIRARNTALLIGIVMLGSIPILVISATAQLSNTVYFPRQTPTPFDGGAVLDNPSTHLAAIQRIIDEHGSISIPSGTTWTIDGPIVVNRPNVTVKGSGWSSIIIQSGTAANVFNVQPGGDGFTVEGIHGVGKGDTVTDLTKHNFVFSTGVKGVSCRENISEGFSGCSFQFRNTKVISVEDNLAFGAVNTHATGADVLTYGSCNYVTIANNRLFSSISQNIYVSALPSDSHITITGNICDTLDSSFNQITPTTKRHSIIASYGPTTGRVRTLIDGNICANTMWTGIYVQGSSKGIVVSNNVCTKNGLNTSGSSLGGGIQVVGTTDEIIVQGNIIEQFASTEAGIGGITINSSGKCVSVIDNQIVEPAGVGIQLGLNGNNFYLVGNQIIKPGSIAINVASNPSLNSSGLIKSNTISGASKGVRIDPQGEGGLWQLVGNIVEGTGGGNGFELRTRSVRVIDNSISNFGVGVWQLNYNGSMRSYYMSNYIDCTNGFRLAGSGPIPTRVQPVYNTQWGPKTMAKFVGGGGYSIGKEETSLATAQ